MSREVAQSLLERANAAKKLALDAPWSPWGESLALLADSALEAAAEITRLEVKIENLEQEVTYYANRS
jgi:hypothetical protein